MQKNRKNVELLDTLQLIRSKNIGPKTYLDLVSWYGSAVNVINNIPSISERTGVRKIKIANRDEIELEYNRTIKLGGNFVSIEDPNYPQLLNLIDSPPIVLSYFGNLEIISQNNNISIVGARNASLSASQLIYNIAKELGNNGNNIVSGLARGIDHAAHSGALASKFAKTTAVMAGGINIAGSSDKKTYQDIKKTGLIISEMPISCEPTGHFFPRRNRIISGLSTFVLIIEANKNSGSMITANFAIEQGREVGVIASFPTDPRSTGGNYLIKNGAHLISSANDIINIMEQFPGLSEREKKIETTEPHHTKINEEILIRVHRELNHLLSSEPTSLSALAKELKLPVQYIRIALLEKEIAETIKRIELDKYILLNKVNM